MTNVIPFHATNNARKLIDATPPLDCKLKKRDIVPILTIALEHWYRGNDESAQRLIIATIARLERQR